MNPLLNDDEGRNQSCLSTLFTVRQFIEKHSVFTEGGIRHLIFNEEENGFKEAFLNIGRKRIIDEVAFFRILKEQNSCVDGYKKTLTKKLKPPKAIGKHKKPTEFN